jgi:hypothetical protein
MITTKYKSFYIYSNISDTEFTVQFPFGYTYAGLRLPNGLHNPNWYEPDPNDFILGTFKTLLGAKRAITKKIKSWQINLTCYNIHISKH